MGLSILSLGRQERFKQSHTIRKRSGKYCREPIEDNESLD